VDILAYDAEKQHRSVLLCCSDGRVSDISDWSELVTFILAECDMAVVWNLEQFFDAINSIMPRKVVERVNKTGKDFLPDHTKLYYQPGRVFSPTYGRQETNFYAIARYSPDKQITDVTELRDLAYKVVDAYRVFGINATKLTSPVALYSEILNRVPFPRACDLLPTALPMLNMCAECVNEEWRQVYKLGYWPKGEATDLDLSAAYPHFMSQLTDISNAKFFASYSIPPRYSWGIMSGKLTVTHDVSPFSYGEAEFMPKGTFPKTITTDQLWLIRKYGGDFQIEHGEFYLLPDKAATPFKETMERLYKTRDNPNPLVGIISKAIAVGIGGMLQQRFADGNLGVHANQIYAKTITSQCSTRLAAFVYYHQIESRLISALVDGLLFEGAIDGMPDKKVMGQWRKNPESDWLTASIFYQWGGTKRPNMKTISEMADWIKREPKNSTYGDFDLNLLERSRIFEDLPRNGGDLLTKRYESKPYTIG
jgi:hypothetical protein